MSMRRLLSAGTLASVPWICEFAARFIRTVILAHFLSPAQLGIAVVVNVLLALAYLFSDLGIDRFLISRPPGDDAAALATAHALQVIKGFVVAAVIFIAAPTFAWLFGAEGESAGIRWVSVILVMHAFAHLGVKQVERDFRYLPEVKAVLVSQAVSLAAVYPAVLVFNDYRAMIVSLLLSSFIYNAASHVFAAAKYRVSFRHLRLMREAVAYGLPLTANGIGIAANSQLDRALVGHWLGLAQLAIFSIILNFAAAPVALALSILSTLGMPFLVQARDAGQFEMRGYLAIIWAYAIVASGLTIFFAATLQVLVPLIYGPIYQVPPLTQLLICLLVWIRVAGGAPSLLLLVQADTARLMGANLVSGGGLILAVVLLPFLPELNTAIACALAGEFLSLAFRFYAVRRTKLPRGEQVREIGWSFVPSLAAALTIGFVSPQHYGWLLLVLVLAAASVAVHALSGFRRHFVHGGMLALFGAG